MYIISKHTGSVCFEITQGRAVLTALSLDERMRICHLINLLKTCCAVHYQNKDALKKNNHTPFIVCVKLRRGWQGVFTQALSQEAVFSTDTVIQGAHL